MSMSRHRFLLLLALLMSAWTGLAGDSLQTRLARLSIGNLEVEEVSIRDVIKLLQEKARAADPDSQGVNILLLADAQVLDSKVTLRLDRVPMLEAVRYLCLGSGLHYRVEKDALIIFDKKTAPDLTPMETRSFHVPPSVLKPQKTKAANSFDGK